jgi:hypothetical protein
MSVPSIESGKVSLPSREKFTELRPRDYLTESEVELLIKAARNNIIDGLYIESSLKYKYIRSVCAMLGIIHLITNAVGVVLDIQESGVAIQK